MQAGKNFLQLLPSLVCYFNPASQATSCTRMKILKASIRCTCLVCLEGEYNEKKMYEMPTNIQQFSNEFFIMMCK